MTDEKENKKRAKRGLANLMDYQRTFSSPIGKKVLWDLIKSNHVLSSSMVAGEPYVTAHNDGRRCAIMDILVKLKTKPKDLEAMLEQQENSDA